MLLMLCVTLTLFGCRNIVSLRSLLTHMDGGINSLCDIIIARYDIEVQEIEHFNEYAHKKPVSRPQASYQERGVKWWPFVRPSTHEVALRLVTPGIEEGKEVKVGASPIFGSSV